MLERNANFGRCRQERMFRDVKHAKPSELIVPRGRQAQAVAAPFGRFVGTVDKIERQAEVSTERAIGPITARSVVTGKAGKLGGR
jgi:hypothetical protein